MLPVCYLRSEFVAKILYTYLISPYYVSCHLILYSLLTVLILGGI
jgi:hypothetical protein